MNEEEHGSVLGIHALPAYSALSYLPQMFSERVCRRRAHCYELSVQLIPDQAAGDVYCSPVNINKCFYEERSNVVFIYQVFLNNYSCLKWGGEGVTFQSPAIGQILSSTGSFDKIL
jgi:hypothetical protein